MWKILNIHIKQKNMRYIYPAFSSNNYQHYYCICSFTHCSLPLHHRIILCSSFIDKIYMLKCTDLNGIILIDRYPL